MADWKKLKLTDEDDISLCISTQQKMNTVGICDATQMEEDLIIPLISEKKKDGECWIYKDGDFTAVLGMKTIAYKDKYRIVSAMTYPITLETFNEALEIMAIKIFEHMQVQQLTHMEASTYSHKNWETSIYYDIGLETSGDFIDYVHNVFQNLDLSPPHNNKKLTYILNDSNPDDIYLDIYLQ